MNERQPARPNGSASRSSGWRTRRWSPAAAASPATSTFRASFTCGSCAPTTRTPTSSRSTPRPRARCRAWSRCGPRPTSPTCRRSISARGRSRSSRRTASRCWRRTRCAMSASRWRRCSPRIPTSPRTPPIWSPCEVEELPPLLDARDEPGEFSSGRDTEAGDPARRATATSRRCSRRRAHIVELKLTIGRHSGVPLETPRRARPLRRLARRAGAARRREGAAPQQGADRAHAQPRRRRRCSATSRTSAAASASAASSIPRTCWSASPRMRLERPVKWIEDRREHLIAANHSRNQHHHITRRCHRRRRNPRASTT